MARIQVLELPAVYRRDGSGETPFVLVIDHVTEAQIAYLAPKLDGLAEKCGARASLLSALPVDVAVPGVTDVADPLPAPAATD